MNVSFYSNVSDAFQEEHFSSMGLYVRCGVYPMVGGGERPGPGAA